jgi:type III polyketide synthase
MIQDRLKLEEDQTWATWEVYKKYGNMSSGTVLCILDKMRSQNLTEPSKREFVAALAFGPGLAVEGTLLKKLC